ncbi:MAG: hypothetical protein ACJAYJ_004944, partial [Saprospiraceae bacterium]
MYIYFNSIKNVPQMLFVSKELFNLKQNYILKN